MESPPARKLLVVASEIGQRYLFRPMGRVVPPRLAFKQSAFTIGDLPDRHLARGTRASPAFWQHAPVHSFLSVRGKLLV